jgi:hypothetical protein
MAASVQFAAALFPSPCFPLTPSSISSALSDRTAVVEAPAADKPAKHPAVFTNSYSRNACRCRHVTLHTMAAASSTNMAAKTTTIPDLML